MRETEAKWRALVEHWPGHILTIDAANRITSVSRSSVTIDASRDLGRDLLDFVASEEQAELRADLALTRAGEPAGVRRRLRRLPDGSPRWYDTHLMPLEELGVMIVTNNVTQEEEARRALGEREHMAARLRLLGDASQEFSEATGDYDRLLDVIARRLGELLGDLCTIRAVSEDGKMLERGAVYHRDPEIVALAHDLLAAHPQAVGEGATGRVAASGQSLFIPRTSSAEYIASTTPQYRPILERLNVGSVMMVPMSCRGKVIGVATIFRTGPEHPYTEDDLNLVRNLGDHAALAIANARSFLAERAAADVALRANQALHDSEIAHRLLFEASPIPVIVFDVETLDYLAVNEAALRLYGYTHDELLGMKISDLRFPSEAAAVKEAVAALGEGPARGTVRHRRKDGSSFFAEYDSRMLIFGGRRARITVISDVTARHEAEEMRSLLAAIVQSSNDAVVSKRLDGTITSWNAAAERLFGYSATEAVGQPIGIVIPPDRAVEERTLLGRVAAGERVEHYETTRRRKDGTAVEVSISLAPILNASGQVVGASKTARDLTEQRKNEAVLKNTEDQLRQAQKMEAVGRLAGGIAHDFNNMLSVILSYSELLLVGLKPTDSTTEEIEEIRAAALRAAELTRQLLMFSRQQIVAPTVLALNDVLAGTDKMVRRIVGEDIDLIFLPAPGLWRVLADPGQIEQIIMNLVVNARDAMPTGGQLSIETANVELDSAYARQHLGVRPGPHVMLAVSDTGVGMDQATQARIFEPFFTTKEVGKGTGLGLSTVFGIAQQSGGSVWVYSEPGAGTTFKVYFPRVEADLEVARPASSVPATLRGSETILLVEDQEQVRAVAAGILQRSGYRVIVAQNAGDALLLAEKHQGGIHLLLTDVVMPQISGVELARRIALLRPELKVLFMSGYTDDSIVRHGVLDSRMAFLQKPFTPESLTRKLRQVLTSG
jgi:two-component system cell cycle sensor histidine kinase/response regulator CckA